jgi:hypothetical protein
MKDRLMLVLTTGLFLTLNGVHAFAQSPSPAYAAARSGPSQLIATQSNGNDAVANEIAALRKVLQTLNTNLRDITQKLLAPEAKQDDPKQRVTNISTNLDLLTRVEARAEVLRRQLIDLIEKETSYRIRMNQLDEEMRPENIERSLSAVGTTRTVELRDTRRRSLENERRGLENLLNQTTQSRTRLEEDVRQADALVTRMRQRLLPLIDKEIEKISPEPN